MMNKSRKTSNLYNVITYDDDGNIVVPASLTLGTAPASSDNSSKAATTAWIRTYVGSLSYATSASVSAAIAALVDAAPSTLDTLNELAAALGDDPNFATTIATSIGGKLSLTGGTLTGDLTLSGINPRLYFTDTDNNPDYFISNTDGTFTVYDVTNSVGRFKIYTTGHAEFTNNLTAASFIKSGGTAAQFLKADGSVDGNTYLTGITSSQVTTALGYTPYNSSNPSGYVTATTADSTYLKGTSDPGTPGNFSLSIGSNGTYSYVQSHSSQPLELNPVGNAVRIAGNVALHAGNYSSYAQPVLYKGVSTSGDFQTFQSAVGVRFDQVNATGGLTNPPPGYTYGGVLTMRGDNFGFQLWGSHTGDFYYKTQWSGDNYTGWRQVITALNIGSQSVNYATTAGSANAVAWTNVSGRPTAVSSFSNDSGYITSSYVSWGNISSRPSWMTSASLVATHSNANDWQNSGFYENGGGGSNWPSSTWYNSINVRHSNQGNYHGFQVAMSYYDNLLWFRSYQGSGSFQSWAYAISSANIGSQSVNYASSAGAVAWANVSGRPTAVSSFTNDSGYVTSGGSVNYSSYSGYSTLVSIPDWRDTNYQPNQFAGNRVGFHFNNTNALGGNSDFWMAVQTVSPWSSYDPSHRQQQMMWGGSGGLSFRYATSTTAWSGWQRIMTSDNSAYAWNMNQYVRTTDSPSFVNVYASSDLRGLDVYTTGGWFRNHSNTNGVYWSTTGWHLMPYDGSDFRMHSGSTGAVSLRMETNGTTRGYMYANSSNEIGFLNNSRGWIMRMTSGGDLIMDNNYGNSIVGAYSSTRFQGVYSMGNAYKLAIDGTSPGNLYGISWGHPNAGGQAGYLNDHGMMVMVNGVTYSAISSNIWARGTITANGSAFANGNRLVENNGGSWGITISGRAAVATATDHYSGRTDSASYNVVWAAGDPSHLYSCNAVTIQSSSGTLSATNLSAGSNLTTTTLYFNGVGGDSGQYGAPGYAIYQQGGAWGYPYPDLCIGYHTGIKMGAYYGYGGIRIYNNSDWGTITASFHDGDQNFRGYYDIIAYASDRRLKHKVQPIENALEKVNSLTGMTYQWNEVGSQHGWEPDTEVREAGVFAQDVQAVLPEAVKLAPFDQGHDKDGKNYSKSGQNFLTVKYEKIVPLLIEAIKEQQVQVEAQQSEIAELKDLIKQLLTK